MIQEYRNWGEFAESPENNYLWDYVRFFTYPPIEYPFHLFKFSHFHKLKGKLDYRSRWYLIDCGIYEMQKTGEYDFCKWEILKNLNYEPRIEFVIPDYPLDILTNDEKWIDKTFENYHYFFEHYSNVNLMPSIQFLINNFYSFKRSFFRFIKAYPDHHRIGIGNLCKQKELDFFKQLATFLRDYDKKDFSFHIFGLTLNALSFFRDFKNLTFDSTKWHSRRELWQERSLTDFKNSKQHKIYYFQQYLRKIHKKFRVNSIKLNNYFYL